MQTTSRNKSIYHKGSFENLADITLRSVFYIPKGTRIDEDKNSVTFNYPSGKKYTRYFTTGDPVAKAERLPTNTKIEHKEDRDVYIYPSGKRYVKWKNGNKK